MQNSTLAAYSQHAAAIQQRTWHLDMGVRSGTPLGYPGPPGLRAIGAAVLKRRFPAAGRICFQQKGLLPHLCSLLKQLGC